MRCEAIIRIVGKLGLHSRSVAKFVKVADRYECDIWYEQMEMTMDINGSKIQLSTPGYRADGRSIMEMLALGAPFGTRLRVICEGSDAEEALSAITELAATDLDPDWLNY
jgi:phosphocarrier protein